MFFVFGVKFMFAVFALWHNECGDMAEDGR